MSAPVREPAVAGAFYEGSREGLLAQLREVYLSDLGPGHLPEANPQGPRRILGLVSPHAGYVYSGATAAHAFAALAEDGAPGTVLVIGPAHRMGGFGVGLQTQGAWRTPLGAALIDEATAQALAAALPEAVDDVRAFTGEHSQEVQVPFLQHLYGDALRIVPMIMVEQGLAVARRVGEALAQTLADRDAVIVASTDMTHYQSPGHARRQDLYLAGYIEKLDAEGLLRERAQQGISMCGYGPTAAMLLAARALGATRGEVLAYHHSGEVVPVGEVVGYLAARVLR